MEIDAVNSAGDPNLYPHHFRVSPKFSTTNVRTKKFAGEQLPVVYQRLRGVYKKLNGADGLAAGLKCRAVYAKCYGGISLKVPLLDIDEGDNREKFARSLQPVAATVICGNLIDEALVKAGPAGVLKVRYGQPQLVVHESVESWLRQYGCERHHAQNGGGVPSACLFRNEKLLVVWCTSLSGVDPWTRQILRWLKEIVRFSRINVQTYCM